MSNENNEDVVKHTPLCKIRPRGVICKTPGKGCDKCGWSYEIEKQRKKKMGVRDAD